VSSRSSTRLAALEQALGTKLFLRTPEGYVATPAGEDVVAHAEMVERAALAIERRADGDTRIEGIVRVTTSEGFTGFLVKRLPALRAKHPGLVVEILSGNVPLDLSRGGADLAIRMTATTQPDAIVRRLGTIGWSLYAASGRDASGSRARAASARGD
jgi:DNA-binding transcriptional LysR family regulator